MSETSLRADFGDGVVDALLERIAAGETRELDPRLSALSFGLSDERTRQLLDAAADAGLLERYEIPRCPACAEQLDAEAAAGELCPFCQGAFADRAGVLSQVVYRLGAQRTRDIPWLVAIHGFNTDGSWQQEFSWRIATKLKYSAPVLIYKYGLIRFSVLARWRHVALARRLGKTLRAAMSHAKASRIPEPPDVVLHSFGSQLFVQLLALPEFDDLKFGRVIAAGSVIRPNYNWTQRIEQGRIEAVLAHCGGKDMAVPFAQIFIPGTGPAARHGFTDSAALNVMSPEYKHSSCFDMQELQANLATGGLWDRFLRQPPEAFAEGTPTFRPRSWRPIWRPLRGFARLAGVLLMAAIASVVLALISVGWLSLLGAMGLPLL